MSETGKTIQELRIQAGFTQKALADALHITDKAVSKWERGICLPDVSLLPKLAMLLDVDMDVLVSTSIHQEKWAGLIDIPDCDFSQIVYDKPMVYYLLTHFLLLDIREIYVLTSKQNRDYLSDRQFREFGFEFIFNKPEEQRVMILTHPWFLFGSNLTQQFQGAILSGRNVKLIPENQAPVVFFAPNAEGYFKEPKRFIRSAFPRTLGRGMVCLSMNDRGNMLDVATFVRTYQENTGLLIGSLEEVSFRKGLLSSRQLEDLALQVPYGGILRKLGKPEVG